MGSLDDEDGKGWSACETRVRKRTEMKKNQPETSVDGLTKAVGLRDDVGAMVERLN